MSVEPEAGSTRQPSGRALARTVLFTFLLTFIAARIVVFLIMSRRMPDLYLHLGGSHIHHLNYGIFILSALGGFLLFCQPQDRALQLAAVAYGFSLALTFDEFGMWVRLGGSYWQRASVDAVGVVAALLGLIAYAPTLKKFRTLHWFNAGLIVVAVVVFFAMLFESFRYAGRIIGPKLYRLESGSPP